MDIDRLTNLMEPHGDAGLTLDEAARYDDGTMGAQERAEIDAFLACSPIARFDLEEARRQRRLEANPVTFADPVSDRPKGLRWSWAMPLAFAGAMVLAAFFAGRETTPIPVVRPTAGVLARSDGEQRAQEDLKKASIALHESRKAHQRDRAELLKQSSSFQFQKAALIASTAKTEKLKGDLAYAEARVAQSLKSPSPSQRVARRYDDTTQEQMRRAVEGRIERGDGNAGGVSAFRPESFAPEDASSKPLSRLVLKIDPTSAPFEWRVWGMRGGNPRWSIPVRTSVVKDRTILDLSSSLAPGRYAVGGRPLEANPTKPEKQRPWQAYAFRILKPEETDRLNAAHVYASRFPMQMAMELFDLDRFGEAAAILRKNPNVPDAKRTLLGLENGIRGAQKGHVFAVNPDDVGDGAPSALPLDGAIPLDVAVGLGPQEGSRPLPGDSPAALQAIFAESGSATERTKRLDLLGQAFDMAERLALPEQQTHAALSMFGEFAGGKVADGEPYVARAVAAARKVLRAGDAGNPSGEALGVLYLGGATYVQTLRFSEALSPLEEGEAYARRGGNDAFIAHMTFERALANLGAGRLSEAVAGWRDTLGRMVKMRASNDPHPNEWLSENFGAAESYLAVSLYQFEDYDGALAVCEGALRDPSVSGNDRIILLKTQASVEIERGADAEVVRDLDRAGSLYTTSTPPDVKTDVETAYGAYYFKRRLVFDARTHLNKARNLAREASRPDMEHAVDVILEAVAVLEAKGTVPEDASSFPSLGTDSPLWRMVDLQGRAESLLSQRRWSEAEEAAQEEMDLARTNKLSVLRGFNLTNLAWAKANQKRYDDALPLFEQGRRALAESLSRVEPERMGNVQQRSAAGLYAQYAWTLDKRGRIDDAQAELNGGRALGLRAKRGDRPRDERAAVRKAIDARPGTLFLQYAALDGDRSLLLVSSAHAPIKSFELLFGAQRLETAVLNWGASLGPPNPEEAEEERRAAQGLGAALLGKIEKAGFLDPKRFPHLVVVGDASFQKVPFAALIDGTGKRIVERFAVGYALAIGLEKSPVSSTGLRPMLEMAYAGGGSDTDFARGTLQEAQAVKGLFPEATLLQGVNAQATTAKREMGNYRVLFLSSHGALNAEDPLDSSLVLAPGGGQDGTLKARDVAKLRLRAELTVLSGCETGTGEEAGGDGLMGMAWAFQAAGSRSVVGTGWRVNDEASRELVVAFFKELKAGKTKDESLRQAALAMIRSGRAHPYYWAGFRLIGDPSPILP